MHAGIIATPVAAAPPAVARQYFMAQNLGQASNADATTWTNHCTLTFTPDSGKDYVIFWSFEMTCVAASFRYAEARLTLGGSAIDTLAIDFHTADDWPSQGLLHKLTGAGTPITLTLDFRRANDADVTRIAYLRGARIVALRLESGDQWAESLASQTNTSAGSFSDAVSLSFTPASMRPYLILGAGAIYGSGAQQIRLSDGTTTVTPITSTPLSAPWGQVAAWVQPGLSGAKTYHLQYRCNGAFDSTIIGARLLALDLSGFSHAYHAEMAGPASTSSTSYEDALTLSRTITADDFLVISAFEGYLTGGQNGVPHIRLTDQSGEVIEAHDTQLGTGAQVPGFVATIGAYAAGVRSWALQGWGGATAPTPGATLGDNAVIAVLKLN
jgi:hypothetical protein